MKTLYEELVAAGVVVSNHYSDLYCQATPEAKSILAKYPVHFQNARYFTNESDKHKGERWIDIPFAYEPYWEGKKK